ncbi:hypothetical protein [Sinorhizobium fredii]|uniref:hypothetical protein n=1 Tax=Rhizobium fredii TaxID=380 RepID=UPI0004B56F36|nr:hypothetical protein [Sinorhizobium fredii]
MKIKRDTPVDRTIIPAALLPAFKTHCRVEFSRDDQYLTQALARALDVFERLTEFHVFGVSYIWTPDWPTGSTERLRLPLQPVEAMVVTDVDGNTDISASYEIVGEVGTDQVAQQWLQPVSGASWPAASASVKLTIGYADAAAVPPGIVDIAFRVGSFLYENRDMTAITAVDVMAYANSFITGYWVPRA